MWPKRPTRWTSCGVEFISVPFTWDLPGLREELGQQSLFNRTVVGGPAVNLMPDYLSQIPGVTVMTEWPGDPNEILGIINPDAVRTTIGCPHGCPWCGVCRVSPGEMILKDRPRDRRVIMDDNILAAGLDHFAEVCQDLIAVGPPVQFQGLDIRFITAEHAKLLKKVPDVKIRVALDTIENLEAFDLAYEKLRRHKIRKDQIYVYCLVAYDTGPDECWRRCNLIAKEYKLAVLPQWFHELDALDFNIVTKKQGLLGWTDFQRRRLMQWFYWRKVVKF